jgi:glycosyltransferase involved in cell wall biosynthesis
MVLRDVPAFYRGTSPNKFFDYLAAGIPVVNNYPGWLAGLIAENRCGIVVPPADPVAFADALQRLAADPDTCRAMGAAARALAEKEFARGLLADRFVETLEAACP